jgi:transcriptional regulator
MKICDFTKPELDYFRENCNFVNDEITVFEMRASGKSLDEIANETHLTIDNIRKISVKVNKKILKVI